MSIKAYHPNPTFSISRIAVNGALEGEHQVVGDILALVTLPFVRESPVSASADVRRTCYRTVAANEIVGLLTETKSTAQSTAQLALKLGETGALNKLDQARGRPQKTLLTLLRYLRMPRQPTCPLTSDSGKGAPEERVGGVVAPTHAMACHACVQHQDRATL